MQAEIPLLRTQQPSLFIHPAPDKSYPHFSILFLSDTNALSPKPYMHLILLQSMTVLGDVKETRSSLLCSIPHPIISSLIGQNIVLSTLISNNHSLRSSLNVRGQV